MSVPKIKTAVREILAMAADISDADYKLDALCSTIEGKQSMSNNKVIVFSSFRHTCGVKKEKKMVELYKPKVEDLWFREKLLGDEDTMSYNRAWGGTIPFPEERRKSWYDKWVLNCGDKRFYRYVKENDVFLGEAAYHFDDERQIYVADVIIYAPYRGRGYGKQALTLLCKNAACNGVRTLFDDIAIDNPSIELFIECGFSEELRTNEYILVKKDLGNE